MAPAPAPDPSQARRLLGAVGGLLLLFALALPWLRPRVAGETLVAGAPLGSQSATPSPSSSADQQIEQLQAASDQLRRAAADALASKAAAPSSADATACMESLVTQDTFGPGKLDWVCGQPDLWSLQLDLYARAVKRGKGEAAGVWLTLGRNELGAIAILRTACCPGAAPFVAKVRVSSCGSLPEVLTALASDPTAEQARRYQETMACLAERKIWFPEGWKRVNEKQSQRSFDAFLATIRQAGK